MFFWKKCAFNIKFYLSILLIYASDALRVKNKTSLSFCRIGFLMENFF